MISIRYSIPPPLISRYTSVISEATGFNYIAIRRHIVGFNPCFLEGRDYRCKTAKLISKQFQPTLPRRERPLPLRLLRPPQWFQSTFPRGERQQSSINFLYISCYYLCNYTNIIPVMQAQLTILISLYLNITVRISQTLYAHFCFAPIRYCIAALFNITKTTITLCS